MKKILSEFFKSAREGFNDGVEDVDKADWQTSFDRLTDALHDETVPDYSLVKRYFDFIARYPEKRMLENVKYFLDQMMKKRPNTISIIKEFTDKAKNIQ